SLDEAMGKCTQKVEVLNRGTSFFNETGVGAGYQIHLISRGHDDLYIRQPAEQLRLHRHTRTEKSNTAKSLLLNRRCNRIQETDKGQRSYSGKLSGANLRGK